MMFKGNSLQDRKMKYQDSKWRFEFHSDDEDNLNDYLLNSQLYIEDLEEEAANLEDELFNLKDDLNIK